MKTIKIKGLAIRLANLEDSEIEKIAVLEKQEWMENAADIYYKVGRGSSLKM